MTCEQFRYITETIHPNDESQRQYLATYQHFLACAACRQWMLDFVGMSRRDQETAQTAVALANSVTAYERG